MGRILPSPFATTKGNALKRESNRPELIERNTRLQIEVCAGPVHPDARRRRATTRIPFSSSGCALGSGIAGADSARTPSGGPPEVTRRPPLANMTCAARSGSSSLRIRGF